MRISKSFNYISKCEKCGKEFSQSTTQYKIDNKKCKRFCSRACANSHIRSEESKAKISDSLNRMHEDRGTSRQSNNPEHRKNCSVGWINGLKIGPKKSNNIFVNFVAKKFLQNIFMMFIVMNVLRKMD